jgi:hypothetical protein
MVVAGSDVVVVVTFFVMAPSVIVSLRMARKDGLFGLGQGYFVAHALPGGVGIIIINDHHSAT